MSETNPPYELQSLPVEAQAERRQALLDDFAERPNDDRVWQTAYDWVRTEGDNPDHTSIASDIPAEELIAMAQKVRQTPQADRYDLMATRASNEKYWFDVIEGFSSDKVRSALRGVVKSWVTDENTPLHFNNALDIGTGAGKSLAILEGCADNVVGLDQNPALLSIAKERAGMHTSLVHSTAEDLPFEDSSFDIILSQGLRAALDKHAAMGFVRELDRVITPNGVYIEGHYYSDEAGNPHPELASFTESSKSMLSDMIGDIVSGALARTDRLAGDQEQNFLTSLGLDQQHYDVLDDDGVSHTLITVITKMPAEAENQSEPGQKVAELLTGFSEYGFDSETIDEIARLPFEEAFEVAYSYLTQAGLDANAILVNFIE